jgi:hypothetical protein
MKFALVLSALLVPLIWYAIWGRRWLKSKPWSKGFFAWIEPLERVLFRKSETILWARIKIAVGGLLTLLTYLGTIDLAPIMPFVPEKYQALVHSVFNLLPMTISLMGMIDEKLRNKVTAPIEMVALAPKDITPKVAEAVAMADSTKTEALAAIAKKA